MDVIEIGTDGCFELPEVPVEPEVWKPQQTKPKENKPTAPTPDKSANNTPSKVFKAQSLVELKGLKTEDLNGRQATVISYDKAAGRYVVALADSDKNIKIRPENLFHAKVSTEPSQPQPAAEPQHTSGSPTVAAVPAKDTTETTTVVLDPKTRTVVVKVKFSALESSEGITLQVSKTDLILKGKANDDLFVKAEFPVPVQPGKATSKFFKKSKTMKISIPAAQVKP